MKNNYLLLQSVKTALTVPVECFAFSFNNRRKNIILKRIAFTLAEVLITLTIIGIIAAMTIPTLYSRYTKHAYVARLKKAYSQLQNAMRMIPISEGCSGGDFYCAGLFDNPVRDIDGQTFNGSLGKKQLYLLSKQFKTHKFCYNYDYATDDECKKLLAIPKDYSYSNTASAGFLTDDGTAYFLITNNTITADINGVTPPNLQGRDLFNFYLTENGVEPAGINRECIRNNKPTVDCTWRVLKENAMNY